MKISKTHEREKENSLNIIFPWDASYLCYKNKSFVNLTPSVLEYFHHIHSHTRKIFASFSFIIYSMIRHAKVEEKVKPKGEATEIWLFVYNFCLPPLFPRCFFPMNNIKRRVEILFEFLLQFPPLFFSKKKTLFLSDAVTLRILP